MTSIEKAKSVLPLPELMARCGLGDRAKKSAKCPFHWIIALDDAKKNADDKRGARFVTRFTKPSRNTQEEIPPYEWHLVTDNANGKVSISYEQTQTLEVFMQLITDGVTDCAELAAGNESLQGHHFQVGKENDGCRPAQENKSKTV